VAEDGSGPPPASAPLRVEVIYAEPGRHASETLELPAGSTVADALDACTLQDEFPDMEIDPKRLGIYGRKVALTQVLQKDDRVEILRPLLADPKAVRRERAEAQKSGTSEP